MTCALMRLNCKSKVDCLVCFCICHLIPSQLYRQGFVNCIKQICTSGLTSDRGGMDDDIIAKVMDCIGLEEGMGPGIVTLKKNTRIDS